MRMPEGHPQRKICRLMGYREKCFSRDSNGLMS